MFTFCSPFLGNFFLMFSSMLSTFFFNDVRVLVYVFEPVLENDRGLDIRDKPIQLWKVLC